MAYVWHACPLLDSIAPHDRRLTLALSRLASVSNAIPSSRFKNSYGSTLSVAAFWTVFLGACLALVAFVVGLIPSRITYAAAAALTVLAWIGLAIGSAVSAPPDASCHEA
jgi:hypothetical protein